MLMGIQQVALKEKQLSEGWWQRQVQMKDEKGRDVV